MKQRPIALTMGERYWPIPALIIQENWSVPLLIIGNAALLRKQAQRLALPAILPHHNVSLVDIFT